MNDSALLAWNKLKSCINVSYYIGPKDEKCITNALESPRLGPKPKASVRKKATST